MMASAAARPQALKPARGRVIFHHPFLLLGLIAGLISCSRDEDKKILATIGGRAITEPDFVKRYEDFRRRTGGGVNDNAETRRQILNNIVDEELLIAAAEKRGYAEDRDGKRERERLEVQELLDAFNRRFIAHRVRVSETELQQLFVNLNTRIKARHLYAPTPAQADSLYAALQNGASFAALAKRCFNDPVLRDSGGELGYFTVDEMEPAFEEAAYALKVGQTSQPVRTLDGYSIIRVEARVTKPLLTENEYAQHRDKLEGYWRTRKVRAATQAYVDSLRRALELTFNAPVLEKLLARLNDKARPLIEPVNFLNGDSEFGRQELLRSQLGVWNVAAFQERLRLTSAPQHKWIRNRETLEDFIGGLVARDFILTQARAAKLDRTPPYQKQVAENFDLYLLERMEENLRSELQIPEDSLRSYFAKNARRFEAPGEVNLREIVLRDQTQAERVAAKLKQGAAFVALAKKYSTRRWSAERGGELGYLKPEDFGQWADKVFSMPIGERVGPVQMDSMYVFLECIGKRPARPRSFEEARPDVEEALRTMYWDDVRRRRIDEIRRNARVVVYPERLATIRLQ